jgi:cell division protein FtsL
LARELSRQRLDRLIRGRSWIALVAFALIGIVVLQLLVLKLNANIGRELAREGSLQRENAALSIEGSELAAGSRVESRAASLGMELVPISSLRFLTARPRVDAGRAAAALGSAARARESAVSGESAPGEAASGGASASSGASQASEASTTSSTRAPSSAAGEAVTSTSEARSGESQGSAAAPAAGAAPSSSTGSSGEGATTTTTEAGGQAASGAGGGTRSGGVE